MTDTERKRIDAICKVAKVKDIGDLSDGFHTFNSLYYQRMILFATLVKTYKDRAWKSLRHDDGELCFGGGWFIVGIDTPEGSYTYHYETKYFDLFDCDILDYGKHWDGHTEEDVTRLLSLTSTQLEPMCINLNEPIKVKLTDWGKEIYYHQYDRINKIAGREICKPSFPREDENGYTEFQLWCFMELYGKHIEMTLPNIIEPLEIVYER